MCSKISKMKSDKLNEFLSSINNLETLNCYYWNDNTIGSQYVINYDTLKEEVLSEIFINISSHQQHQLKFYFYQLYNTIENFIKNTSPTFSKEAKIEYERHLLECWKDEDFELFLCGDFKTIFDKIFEERFVARLDLINSLKSKIKEIESIYFDSVKRNENITINELNEIENKVNSIIDKKLKWKGTPAQFCYIIDLLINKGYLEQPTPKGERSAKVLLSHFEFENDNPSFESLGRNLHKNFDPIKNVEHRILFQKMPHRNDLDK